MTFCILIKKYLFRSFFVILINSKMVNNFKFNFFFIQALLKISVYLCSWLQLTICCSQDYFLFFCFDVNTERNPKSRRCRTTPLSGFLELALGPFDVIKSEVLYTPSSLCSLLIYLVFYDHLIMPVRWLWIRFHIIYNL